jgi:hypothetical protein
MSRFIRSGGGQSKVSSLNTQWEYIYSCSNWTCSLGTCVCFEIPFENYNAIKAVFIGAESYGNGNCYCIGGYQCYYHFNPSPCTTASFNTSIIYTGGGGPAVVMSSTEEVSFYPSCGCFINFHSRQLGSLSIPACCREFYGYSNLPDITPYNWNCVSHIRLVNSCGIKPHCTEYASFHILGQYK